DAYLALFDFARGQMGSYVADCYNYREAVKNYLIPLARQAEADAKAGKPVTVVGVRPDSGDPHDEIRYALDLAVENDLYQTVTAADGRTLVKMTHLKVIQADGMSFKTMQEINGRLMNTPVCRNGEKIADGYSPVDCVMYGVGGYFADSVRRS